MARFHVYPNPDGATTCSTCKPITRVVVPLLPLDAAPSPANTLNPVFMIEGNIVVMVSQFLAAIPAQILNVPVASLSGRRTEIAALDLLFQGAELAFLWPDARLFIDPDSCHLPAYEFKLPLAPFLL